MKYLNISHEKNYYYVPSQKHDKKTKLSVVNHKETVLITEKGRVIRNHGAARLFKVS